MSKIEESVVHNSQQIIYHIGLGLCLGLFYMTLLFMPKEIITNDIGGWFLGGTIVGVFFLMDRILSGDFEKELPIGNKVIVLFLITFILGVYLSAILGGWLGGYVISISKMDITSCVIATYFLAILFYPLSGCLSLNKILYIGLPVFLLVYFLSFFFFNFNTIHERLNDIIIVKGN